MNILRRHCVDQIDPFMLTDTGNAFTSAGVPPLPGKLAMCLSSPVSTDIRHTPDTWETYDEVAILIEARYDEWRSTIGG